MPRVGKAKRLRRRARLERNATRREDYQELAERFRAHMAAHGLGGIISVDDNGVTIRGGGAVMDCSKTGGVGFSL